MKTHFNRDATFTDPSPSSLIANFRSVHPPVDSIEWIAFEVGGHKVLQGVLRDEPTVMQVGRDQPDDFFQYYLGQVQGDTLIISPVEPPIAMTPRILEPNPQFEDELSEMDHLEGQFGTKRMITSLARRKKAHVDHLPDQQDVTRLVQAIQQPETTQSGPVAHLWPPNQIVPTALLGDLSAWADALTEDNWKGFGTEWGRVVTHWNGKSKPAALFYRCLLHLETFVLHKKWRNRTIQDSQELARILEGKTFHRKGKGDVIPLSVVDWCLETFFVFSRQGGQISWSLDRKLASQIPMAMIRVGFAITGGELVLADVLKDVRILQRLVTGMMQSLGAKKKGRGPTTVWQLAEEEEEEED